MNRNNSLNTIRLLAALQVMWGHMIVHLNVADIEMGGVSVKNGIGWILNYFPGVPIFFFMSGFLIWKSVERDGNWKIYFQKRFLRLYPELWIALAIEVITIIVFYFNSIEWKLFPVFIVTQATVFQFWTPEFLRGYGCGTPNGSLWTIVIFVQFYALIWSVHKTLNKKNPIFWILLELFLIVVGVLTSLIESFIPEIIFKMYGQTIIPYLWIFCLGMMVSKFWDKWETYIIRWAPLSIPLYVIACLTGVDIYAGFYPVFKVVITTIGTLGLAFALPRINIKIDISYEMYLLHMIFLNVMISIGIMGVSGMAFAICFTFVFCFIIKRCNVILQRMFK